MSGKMTDVEYAIWEVLEPHLEDVINLDLNNVEDYRIFRAIVEKTARAATESMGMEIEYVPGHLYERDGKLTAFVRAGRIAPDYVQEYVNEGGEALWHYVGPYAKVEKS